MKTVNTDIFIGILLDSGCIEAPDRDGVFNDPTTGYSVRKLISPCRSSYSIIKTSSEDILLEEADTHLSRLNLDDLIGNIPWQ